MNKILRSALFLASLLGLASSQILLAAPASSEVKIDLPAENARFKPGPGMETAARNCMICHSVDYIYMQPPLTKNEWQAEVMKMKKVFGAPVSDADVETIVNYLMTQNGKQ